MLRTLLMITAFLAASAQAESFRFQPAIIMNYDCTSATTGDCTEEFVIPGIVEVNLVDGRAEWSQSYNSPSGTSFYYSFTVMGSPGSYDIFAYALVSPVTGTGYQDAYFNVTTPADTSLNRVATSTMAMQIGNTFSSIWMQIEPPTSPARSKEDLRRLARPQFLLR